MDHVEMIVLYRFILLLSMLCILFSAVLFLFLPTEFLQPADAILEAHRPTAAPPKLASFFDRTVGHTRFVIPADSSLVFNLAFPFPPCNQFILKLSTLAKTKQKSSLRVEVQSKISKGWTILLERSLKQKCQSIHVPFSHLPRKFRLRLDANSEDVQIEDIRIIFSPWISTTLGTFLFASSFILYLRIPKTSRRPLSKRTLRRIFAITLVSIMSLVVFGVLEIFLRAFPSLRPAMINQRIHSYPLKEREFFYEKFIFDKELAFKRPRNFRVNFTLSEGDLSYLTSTTLRNCIDPKEIHMCYDAEGFHNVPGKTPPDIVFLGDSSLEDPKTPKTLCEYFQDLTQLSCSNLGLSCIGTHQERIILERFGFPKEPKMVILIFFEGNDLGDNIMFARFCRDGPQSAFKHFGFLFDPAPPLLHYAPVDKLLIIKFIPRYPQWSSYVIAGVKMAEGQKQTEHIPGDDCSAWGKENNVALPSIREGLRIAFYPQCIRRLANCLGTGRDAKGWQIARRELKKIRDQCSKKGINFIVCFLPSKSHVYLQHVRASWGDACFEQYLHALVPDAGRDMLENLHSNADALRNLLNGFCQQNGIPFIDFYPALSKESFKPPLLYYCNDTHLTPYGHKIAALEIYRWMADNMPEFFARARR